MSDQINLRKQLYEFVDQKDTAFLLNQMGYHLVILHQSLVEKKEAQICNGVFGSYSD